MTKAFLQIGGRKEHGYIEFKELAKFVARHDDTKDSSKSFNELKEILTKRGLLDEGGKMSFNNFRRWIGPTIDPKEEFYFRHDAIDNPTFYSF
jgi:hypothetical protein